MLKVVTLLYREGAKLACLYFSSFKVFVQNQVALGYIGNIISYL